VNLIRKIIIKLVLALLIGALSNYSFWILFRITTKIGFKVISLLGMSYLLVLPPQNIKMLFFYIFDTSIYVSTAILTLFCFSKLLKKVSNKFIFSTTASIGFFLIEIILKGPLFFEDPLPLIVIYTIVVFVSYIGFTSLIPSVEPNKANSADAKSRAAD